MLMVCGVGLLVYKGISCTVYFMIEAVASSANGRGRLPLVIIVIVLLYIMKSNSGSNNRIRCI